jgi:lipoyl(octanoyl) transferase
MAYEPCVEIQKKLLEDVASSARPNTLVLVEHDPVLTLGAAFHEENLLFPVAEYERRGIKVVRTDRGGDVTYHGPGQLVIYPIFNLAAHGKDLHKWLRDLEQTIIVTLEGFNIRGDRFPPHTGVWVGDRKVAAMGIKVKRWISMHGAALNCNVDLSPFGLIVPCGIHGYGVTSMSAELGRDVMIEETKPVLIEAFKTVFGATF